MIQIDEVSLHKIIKEAVDKRVNELLLNEYFYYALERSDFIDRAYFILNPLLIHWCLIRYSRITNTNQEYINHWKRELTTFCFQISNLKLKKGNDVNKRQRALMQAWSSADLHSDPNAVYMLCINKFEEEHINTDTEEVMQTMKECVKETQNLINLLANANHKDIKEYINNL